MFERLRDEIGQKARRHRWVQQSKGFLPRFEKWMLSGSTEAGDHELLLAAFTASGGSLLTRASERFSKNSISVDCFNQVSAVGLTRGTNHYDIALAELDNQGFTILPWLLPENVTNDLVRFLHSSSGTFVGDAMPRSEGRPKPLTAGDLKSPMAEKYSIDSVELLQCKSILDLCLDPGLLAFAQDYLQAIPRLDIISAWFSFPVGRSSDAAATQFHYDLDRTKWLKVFFFLSDVSTETGAHVFIPTTHRDGGIPRQLRDRGYTRIPDTDVESHFPKSDWAFIGGPPGTILIEDTRGLHKGQPLMKGHRLLLQFQFSQNLFGTPSHLSRIPKSAIPPCSGLAPEIRDIVLEALRED